MPKAPVDSAAASPRFDGLRAVFVNATLKPSPEPSNTDVLMRVSTRIMEEHGVEVELIRAGDHDIAIGLRPGMTHHGARTDDWPATFDKVSAPDIHCAKNVLYSLEHLGFAISPQADAGWIGTVGPGPSYLDPGSGGPQNDFTNRNTTFMTYNLMHLAALLRAPGGVPAYGNRRSEWDAGCAPDRPNPEHRQTPAEKENT